MFDGIDVHVTVFLVEVGDLVRCIGDVASRALLKELHLSRNGAVVEPMVKGRH